MENEELETLDSSTEELENTDSQNSETENSTETKEEYTPREKQYYARIKELETKLKEGTQTQTKQTKTDGFGYDVKAYLKSSGIQSNEFDFVQAELKQSGVKDIDTLLENDYFKSRLENHRELAKTTEAIPSGKRSGGVATDSVEYWMAKPIEEVPQEMRIKVVNARLKKEESRGVFYNS